MTRTIPLLAALILCTVATAHALYLVSEKGDWPKSWPKELESLRKQSRTLVGPEVMNQHFAIRFEKQEDFEAAWPYLLKVKSKGAPIFLMRGQNFFLGEKARAGVVVHSPPARPANAPPLSEDPIPGQSNPRMTWMNATTIDLVVDGEIVDLNRIALPPDTPIVDERFPDAKR